ncbi:hypothetical protein NE865_06399 [Phthorimaea operculella]|nr:hypothetical protein NE865_06399 [Phthorimaea operculella]
MESKLFWWVIVGAVVATAALSVYDEDDLELEDDEAELEQGDRKGKILFPFVSVVRFANTECASQSSMNGTCLARRECNNLNGTATAMCASRRGRCCVVQRTCGTFTNVNNTYFTSPGYPTAYPGGQACTIVVQRCNNQICQLRVDFLDMVLAQPNGDGVCATDSITITGGNTIVPPLCGDNTGQTLRWNIRLVQLGCDCPGIAPNGCLQYFTGTTGTIRSFNYGAQANTMLSASLVQGSRQIANLNYGICIRMEAGFCTIQYAQSPNDMFSFTVTGDVDGADATVLGTAVGALNDGACVTDFVVIPNPVVTATNLAVGTDRFCGLGFVPSAPTASAGSASCPSLVSTSTRDLIPNPVVTDTNLAVGTDRFCGLGFVPVTSGVKPFVLTVVTNGDESATATTPPDVSNRGFSLQYTQVAC